MRKITQEGIKTRLKHMGKTIACGFHSGFPPCCIRFYITKWLWIPKDPKKSKFFKTYWKKMEKKRKLTYDKKTKKWKSNFGYIPCPTCLRYERFVEVKPCPKGSHCWHRDEQAQ